MRLRTSLARGEIDVALGFFREQVLAERAFDGASSS